jgi:hypothetical protein
LEVGVGKRLAGTNNSSQITLHQLYVASAYRFFFSREPLLTLVQICLVEVIGSGNVHVVQTCDLS